MHSSTHARESASTTLARRLFDRWFIQHNPLYLLSAMLVLGGTILTSRGLAHDGSLWGPIGVAAIAEIYAAALIGGSALLMRVGQRRSAVMLALLAALYQCDLTLHTETCPNLEWIGGLASGGWLALFLLKLWLLAWATGVRISRSGFATAALGAAGLAILPYVLSRFDSRAGSAIVALWLYALSVLQRESAVATCVELDAWGHVVLRRSVRATWLLWSFLLTLHVLFWCTQYRLAGGPLVIAASLIATRWIRSEARMWLVVMATLVVARWAMPSAFAMSALLAAVSLCVRALSAARGVEEAPSERARPVVTPYRAGPSIEMPLPQGPVWVAVDRTAELRRLLVGAVFAVYLSVWTLGWTGGAWPAHVVWLDIILAAALLLGVWRARARVALVPFVVTWGHVLVQARLVSAPRSALAWGVTTIGFGFALLILSLAAAYFLRPRPEREAAQ